MKGPFTDLSRLQRHKLFDLLGVHIYRFNKNDEVLPTIKNENIVGIVTEGCAQIFYMEYNGNELVLETLYENSVFGTSISGTNNDNIQIVAKEFTEIVVIDYNKLLNPSNLKHRYFNIFLTNLFDIINVKFKKTNERLRILEKKQIRDKLLDFFEGQYKKNHSKIIYLPYSLKDLADFLAVNRSAMFRELKRLKDDRVIDITDKRITLLNK